MASFAYYMFMKEEEEIAEKQAKQQAKKVVNPGYQKALEYIAFKEKHSGSSLPNYEKEAIIMRYSNFK